MFRNLSVRSKLLTIVFTIVVLFASTMIGLDLVARYHVVCSLQSETERASKVVGEFIDSRYRQLDAGLSSLVDSPEIRAVLTSDGVDHDTQLMSITDLQHLLGADVVVYCNEKGRTLARTDDPFDFASQVDQVSVIRLALTGTSSRGILEVNDQVLLAIAFPVTIDGEVRGVVCAGVDISRDAHALSSLLLRDVTLFRNGKSIASSIPPSSHFVVSGELEKSCKPGETIFASIHDARSLPRVVRQWSDDNDTDAIAAAVSVAAAEDNPLLASVLIPHRAIFGFYDDFLKVLLALGATTIALSSLIVFRIGSVISQSVRATLSSLECVAGGDLTSRLRIESTDEFGSIASALNAAISVAQQNVQALALRNRDSRMLLDAVEQGFFTVDTTGVMSVERSGAVDRMLATPRSGMTLVEFIQQFDENVASWLELGLEDVFAGVMPIEVTIDQLPRRFKSDSRTFSLGFTPVTNDGSLCKLAVVITDITPQVTSEKLDAQQRQMLAMVHGMAEDRSGFLEFIHEAREIIQGLQNIQPESSAIVKRRVHTLKGNASIFGLVSIAAACHRIEDYASENNELPNSALWNSLFDEWQQVEIGLTQIVGDRTQGIEVAPALIDRLIELTLQRIDHEELAIELTSWKLEPTEIRLHRLAEQTRCLAKRLGKGEVFVCTEDHGLRLESPSWVDFWASFIHVLRNAIDHGLETRDQRLSKGKSAIGKIQLCTRIESGRLIVSVEDDGRGIDWEKLTESAYSKGLPAESRDDLIKALFHEGVTTASEVTEISGRGVGMAAVKESCEKLGGAIRISSEEGCGTRIEFIFTLDRIAPHVLQMLKEHEVERPEQVFEAWQNRSNVESRIGLKPLQSAGL